MILVQAVKEYIKEYHQEWKVNEPYNNNLQLLNKNYAQIWLFFYDYQDLINVQYGNTTKANTSLVEYNTNSILQTIDEIINKAIEYKTNHEYQEFINEISKR